MEAPKGIGVDYNGYRWRAYFHLSDARYHVWFQPDTMEIDADSRSGFKTLYKNPPHGIEFKQEGWFDARRLDASKKKNAELLRLAFAEIKKRGLVAKAKAKHEAQEQRQTESRRAEARETIKRHYGPQLFDAVKDVALLPLAVVAIIKKIKAELEAQ